jgi:hypothetical protein
MKLHTLFDDTRHEGKNEMSYMAASSVSVDAPVSDMAVDAPDSDMSISEDDDSDNGGPEPDEAHVPYNWPERENAMEEDDNTDFQDDNCIPPEVDSDLDSEGNIEYVQEDNNEINLQAYVTPDSNSDDLQKTEQGGVVHLVHGWIQQAHPERVSDEGNTGLPFSLFQGLFISGDISTSSTSVAATGSHFTLTQSVARTIGLAFKTVFPKWYNIYQKAFEAGVWFQDDSGPFLGRAIVYKLQGRLHRDRHDVGPSVSFPVGQFTGGEMIFPQLNTKLQYVFSREAW